MFEKIKHFFKKEKTMSTTGTDSKTTKQLKKQVSEQAQEIGKLRGRISTLQDELAIVTSEMNNFKTRVAADMKKVVNSLNEVGQKNR
jgi:molecular chaperone GrpE (heat shock protein)